MVRNDKLLTSCFNKKKTRLIASNNIKALRNGQQLLRKTDHFVKFEIDTTTLKANLYHFWTFTL